MITKSGVTPWRSGFAPAEGPNVPSPQGHGPGEPGIQSPRASKEILLVEDDLGIRNALKGVLEDEGYLVRTAANGVEALQILRSGATPNLIVLDLRMPEMDGWEFRAAQKNDPELMAIPVLAVSADGSAKAAAIDAAVYLRKPLSTDTLLNAVAQILAQADRQQLLKELAEAERFAALGRLAASAGHEINNPLTSVSISFDLAVAQVNRLLGRSGPHAVPAQDLVVLGEFLRECRVGLDRIRDIVRQLQGLSRSDVQHGRFSLNDLLDESVAMARHQVEHRARVQRMYGDVPAIAGDRSALGQVFLNLILNAVQALPEGEANQNEVALTTYVRGKEVVAEVRDTGVGIAGDVLPHIFDPFYTTKPMGEGTGLGLAVSFRIVADHGGRIEVESAVRRGSSFRVVLPVAPQQDAPTPAPVTNVAPEPVGVRARILVIDDAAPLGRAISRGLAEYDVTVVTRAEEAFARLAANEPFDVVVCDVVMPELSGRAVHERLRSDWPELARRTIFMTAGAFTPESREFVRGTSQPVLTKPFTIDELCAAIQKVMDEANELRN
jgi:signal transduction histidine kinase